MNQLINFLLALPNPAVKATAWPLVMLGRGWLFFYQAFIPANWQTAGWEKIISSDWSVWFKLWDKIALKSLQQKALAFINKLMALEDLLFRVPIAKEERKRLYWMVIKDREFFFPLLIITILIGLGVFLTVNRRWHHLKWRWLHNWLEKYNLGFQTLLFYLNRTFFMTPEAYLSYGAALWQDGQSSRARDIFLKGLIEFPKHDLLNQALEKISQE